MWQIVLLSLVFHPISAQGRTVLFVCLLEMSGYLGWDTKSVGQLVKKSTPYISPSSYLILKI